MNATLGCKQVQYQSHKNVASITGYTYHILQCDYCNHNKSHIAALAE